MHKRFPAFLSLAALLLIPPAASADTAADRIRAAINQHADGKIEVTSVTATPVPGIFEIVSGAQVFYTDASGRYAFIDGRLVDSKLRKDLTQETLERISVVAFDRLPLDLAIKTVNGSGKRRLAIFEDPACPICREMHGHLQGLADTTLYTFPMPIISPDSPSAAAHALCAPPDQRAAAWQALMTGENAMSGLPEACPAGMERVGRLLALGNRLGIHNTPTLVLGNGQRVVGKVPLEQLDAALDASIAR